MKISKLGPIILSEGISTYNAFTLLYASFFTIGLLTFIGVGTPYVLSEILNVPQTKQGIVTGNLVFWTEITTLLLFGPIGIAADKIGRKIVYVLGFLFMGLGYALYPTAESVNELIFYRVIYAIGVALAAGMLATVLTDYPQERSRGKLVGIVGALCGLGIVVINIVFGTLPEKLVLFGFDSVKSGQIAHWAIATLCFVSAFVLMIGLKGGLPTKDKDSPSLKELSSSAIKHFYKNRKITLAYCSAFIARGDLVILGSFLTLWATSVGIEKGLPIEIAQSKSTKTFVLTQMSALVWTGIILFFIDKINRITFLCLCISLASIGYISIGFVDDPTSKNALPFIILLGIGQISIFFGSQSLVGQEAPEKERGAVIGGFNIMGAIGIVFCSIIGGRIFDSISPNATFFTIGAINILLLLFAIYVRFTSSNQKS